MTITGAPHDWSRYSLSQIWVMLAPQSQADGHVGALMWQQVEDMCRDQADQLETALAKLRGAWPVTQAAAAKFQDWTAKWVAAMRSTSENAKTNGPIIDAIVHEIDAARNKVGALMDDAARYEKLGSPLADMTYVTDQAVHGDWSLTGWREGLNQQARDIMANLEQKISTYAGGIGMEHPFTPLADPFELPNPSASEWTGGPNIWRPSFTAVDGYAAGSGGEADQMPGAPGGSATPGSDISSDSRAVDASSGYTLLASAPVLDSLTGPPSGSWAVGVGPGGSFVDTPAGRVLAPGGLISAPLGSVSAIGSAAATIAATSGMTPVVPPITSGPGASGTSGAATKGAGKRRGRRRTVPNIFEVGLGGPDVILPSDEPDDHDPGPNVFGIDL
jgi:hypothetical protein